MLLKQLTNHLLLSLVCFSLLSSLSSFPQTQWKAEMKLRPEAPQLWRAMVRAFFPVQLPMYLPFVMVTTAKIVQAQVGVRGLIRVLDTGGEAREVRREGGRDEAETRMQAYRHYLIRGSNE